MTNSYILNARDKHVIAVTKELLWKVIRSSLVSPLHLERLSQVLIYFDQLPQVDSALVVTMCLSSPTREYGNHKIRHDWTVGVDNGQLDVDSGGYFYRDQTGGDTFTSMYWSIAPGQPALYNDCRDHMRIVDDAMPYQDEVYNIDLDEPGYFLNIEPKLDSAYYSATDDIRLVNPADHLVGPVTDAERQLARLAWFRTGVLRGEIAATCHGLSCDRCGCRLDFRALFVDGNIRGGTTWAFMCAECFWRYGSGIGWGDGQVYARCKDGAWLLVAGFKPDISKDE